MVDRDRGRPVLPGSIAVVTEDGVPVLRLRGEIDTVVVAAYDERPVVWAGGALPAVIDVSEVTFLDCRGLAFLVRQTRAARQRGGRPVLRRPARVVQRVIHVAGADDQFTVAPD